MRTSSLLLILLYASVLLLGETATAQPYRAIAPLMGTVREDFGVFNDLCPFYTHDDGTVSAERTAVGCVATSAAQLLSHTGRIITLRDTLKGWTTPHYTLADVLPGTTIDTRLILDRYDEGSYTSAQADEVARLSLYAGMAAKMNWGLAESGTSVRRLEEPLRRIFGMPYVHYVERYDFSPADWRAMLVRELEAGRPVLYAGYNTDIHGHAWIIDGMDEQGNFHCRWGYGGHYDGYFSLDRFGFFEPLADTTAAARSMSFHCNHQMLLLSADSVATPLPDKVHRMGREVEVKQLELLLPALAGCYTPARLTVRNRSAQAITLPYEIFTNAPADTNFVKQGDYAALTGLTLETGEERTIDVPLKFDEAGERILRISPDDSTIVYEKSISILPAQSAAYEIAPVSIVQSGEREVTLTLPLTAPATNAGRTGSYLFVEAVPGIWEEGEEGTRHLSYVYLAPGEEQTVTMRFRGLRNDTTYTFLIRNIWRVAQQPTFTLHATTGIETVRHTVASEAPLYDLQGRRARPRKNALRKGNLIIQ